MLVTSGVQVVANRLMRNYRPATGLHKTSSYAVESTVRLMPDGSLHYFQHMNSIMSWPWNPTAQDMVDADWELVDI